MTSPCSLHIFTNQKVKADKIASKILKSSKILEQKYNFYNPNSYLSQINHRKIDKIDIQTKDLLNKAKLFYKKTEGIFDITTGTLFPIKHAKSINEANLIFNQLKPFLGIEHFKIKKDKIIFDNPYTKIDLGGVVKEYAVDKAVQILKKEKIESALINFGGDIFALGKKPNGDSFSIGIKNPLNPSKNLINIKIANQALTTSASYERNYKIENKIYSHIISKAPLQKNIISATVISDTTLEAGIYSTSLMIKPDIKVNLKKFLIDKNLNILTND